MLLLSTGHFSGRVTEANLESFASMRPPHSLLHSRYFQFSSVKELTRALADFVSPEEITEVERLDDLGLAPITSIKVLSVMFGINSGLLWSIHSNPERFYREFKIPKGKGVRVIHAPRVALKLIQKWFSVQLARTYQVPQHVYGFVAGRSHINAAAVHCNARWVYSADIKDFFPSTPFDLVCRSLSDLGYGQDGAELIARLCCYGKGLAQGSPASPVLSNICAKSLDFKLVKIADTFSCRLTRYADDIVFSSSAELPGALDIDGRIRQAFEKTTWMLARGKTSFSVFPNRLKVHGLLVHGDSPRLTKGYRKKIRAYRHLLKKDAVKSGDKSKLQGHVTYANHIDKSFKA